MNWEFYVAEKNGTFAGAITNRLPYGDRRTFFVQMSSIGATMKPMYSRKEYHDWLKEVPQMYGGKHE